MTARAALVLAFAAATACAPRASRSVMPAPPLPSPASEPEGVRWISVDAARATAVGAGPARILATGAGSPGDSLGGRLAAPPDACVLVLARGSPSIEDLDAFVYAEDGAVLGDDETSSNTASVVVCPPHPANFYAFGRVAAGHGLFTVSEQLFRPADLDRVSKAVGAKGELREDPAAAEVWPGLDEALAAHRRELGSAWHDVRRSAVPMDPRLATRVSATVEPNQCLDVFALPSADVAYVELTVLDSDGRIIGRSAAEHDNPSAVVCATRHTDLTLELRPHAGRGLTALVLSVADSPGPLLQRTDDIFVYEADAAATLEQRRTAFDARLIRDGYPAPTTVGKGTISVGKRVSVDLDTAEGCSRLDVLTGDPARGVESWVWSPAGTLVARGEGTAVATSFACGESKRSRLDVEAVSLSGPFEVQMRALHGLPAALSEHPVAAGRLLERMVEGQELKSPRDLGALTVQSVSAELLTTAHAETPASHCVTVAVAVDRGAEGVDLRLLNDETGEELALTHGTYSAMADACAIRAPEALRVRIEVRVAAGQTAALLAVHPRALPNLPGPKPHP
jgi:hypothetical protein